jgi:integrase/recombinase XerD
VHHPVLQLPEDECKKNTLTNYESVLGKFQNYFRDIELSSITPENILAFMAQLSEGTKQSTKKLRFSLLAAFFNFIKDSVDPDFQSPCDNAALRKLFKPAKPTQVQAPDTK